MKKRYRTVNDYYREIFGEKIFKLPIDAGFDGSDGVLRFKQNFNGYIVRKMGTFRYYPQPLKYKAIQGVKKLLGRS